MFYSFKFQQEYFSIFNYAKNTTQKFIIIIIIGNIALKLKNESSPNNFTENSPPTFEIVGQNALEHSEALKYGEKSERHPLKNTLASSQNNNDDQDNRVPTGNKSEYEFIGPMASLYKNENGVRDINTKGDVRIR